jgi:hypothetical protein
MALIARGKSGEFLQSCLLCGVTLREPIFATSHFIADEKDELYRFSDSAMHWDCYSRWVHQERFATLYFEARSRSAESSHWRQYWRVLVQSPTVLVTYGVVVREVSVVLKKSGTDLRVSRAGWPDWLQGGWRGDCRAGLESEAVEGVLSELQRVALPKDA